MYSLYRAWLSLNHCSGLSSLPVPSAPLNFSLSASGQIPDPPDITLQVGPSMTNFSAHRGVLSAHSGFFKAAFANNTGLSPISVPNVNVDEFSSLLTFMYTGYLDLNITNIYNTLLATHILHMPRALEICRHFLAQQGQNTQIDVQHIPKINVIKPIASRKMTPSMQEYFSNHGVLGKRVDMPIKIAESDDHSQKNSKSTNYLDTKLLTDEPEQPISAKKLTSVKTNNRKKCETSTKNNKIIIDVACCDGPVKFHRVINKNYGIQDDENIKTQIDDNQSIRPTDLNRRKAMNKAMNENIMGKMNSNEDQSSEVFTCIYCNHTFKSQYCYQKHARRHLYPVSIDKIPQTEAKREVKLLDMNVQYYPCKTCGSRFPSYYFVHKHRKLCHADEVADKNHRNNEIVVENGHDSSSCSAIDVEAVQNEKEYNVT